MKKNGEPTAPTPAAADAAANVTKGKWAWAKSHPRLVKRTFAAALVVVILLTVILTTIAVNNKTTSTSSTANASSSSSNNNNNEPSDTGLNATPTDSTPTANEGNNGDNATNDVTQAIDEEFASRSSPSPTATPTTLTPTVISTNVLTTRKPTLNPSAAPTLAPTNLPTTQKPTDQPTRNPTSTLKPTDDPTATPSDSPSTGPTEPPVQVTFNPGQLTVAENGLLLSTGLTAKVVARTGQAVPTITGPSVALFHAAPDFGATYATTTTDSSSNNNNDDGWIYVSNSEVRGDVRGQGGVGAIEFDSTGRVTKYKMVLTQTTGNCGGGRTPWGAWISCEEIGGGRNWQVDPTGVRPARPITLGNDTGGAFESFAYDVRNLQEPYFYVTEDATQGAMQRFTPSNPDWDDPWNMLYGPGVTDYLILYPIAYGADGYPVRGVFSWTTSRGAAKENAARFYPNSEGIDVSENELFFVAKRLKTMFILNLDDLTYTNQTTKSGLFDGTPDQLQRIIGHDTKEMLYFTEEGGRDAGVHCRNELGHFFTLFEATDYEDETTGLAFSPDGRHLYVAYQDTGILFDITRTDLQPFQAQTLNLKYHATENN